MGNIVLSGLPIYYFSIHLMIMCVCVSTAHLNWLLKTMITESNDLQKPVLFQYEHKNFPYLHFLLRMYPGFFKVWEP